jgi:hypothetical protein
MVLIYRADDKKGSTANRANPELTTDGTDLTDELLAGF